MDFDASALLVLLVGEPVGGEPPKASEDQNDQKPDREAEAIEGLDVVDLVVDQESQHPSDRDTESDPEQPDGVLDLLAERVATLLAEEPTVDVVDHREILVGGCLVGDRLNLLESIVDLLLALGDRVLDRGEHHRGGANDVIETVVVLHGVLLAWSVGEIPKPKFGCYPYCPSGAACQFTLTRNAWWTR